MSLKYAFSITLATAMLALSLSGFVQPAFSVRSTLARRESIAHSLTIQKGDQSLHPVMACPGCSGNGSGPG